MAKWKCDPAHTSVEFIVKHMMITDIHGYLKNIEGMIDFDPENPLKGSIEVKGQASNISTEHQARDEHLHGVDFFDIVNHPTIEFKSSKMELTGTYEGKLFGNRPSAASPIPWSSIQSSTASPNTKTHASDFRRGPSSTAKTSASAGIPTCPTGAWSSGAK